MGRLLVIVSVTLCCYGCSDTVRRYVCPVQQTEQCTSLEEPAVDIRKSAVKDVPVTRKSVEAQKPESLHSRLIGIWDYVTILLYALVMCLIVMYTKETGKAPEALQKAAEAMYSKMTFKQRMMYKVLIWVMRRRKAAKERRKKQNANK